MSDVQRELYNLREKATAIANDTTREEKIKKLDSDQKWFRNEAMRLDIETNEFRKKMRDIKVTIQSTERERDWLLDKLRAAKDKYKKLKTVRNDLFEKYGGNGTVDGGFSVGSNDSSYTLELQQVRSINQLNGLRATKTSDWREQLQRDYLVTREVSNEKEKKDTLKLKKGKKNSVQLAPLDTLDYPGTKQFQLPMVKNIRHEKEEQERERKELVSRLVTERAKQDGVRDFIGQCYNCASVGSWRKLRSRELYEVLQDCQAVAKELSKQTNEEQINELLQTKDQLIQELVNYPELYDSISILISSQSQISDDHEFNSNDNEDIDRNDEHEIVDGRESARSNGKENYNIDELSLADDVKKYFNQEKIKREEFELNEKSRRLFGGN